MTAEQAMAELWGTFCPDCGPQDYAGIVGDVTAERDRPTPKVREIGRRMAAELREHPPIHPEHATPESIAWAKEAAARERAQFFDAHNAYVSRRIKAKQDLILMVDAWGFETVERWVANMKAMSGRKESR